MLYVTVIVIFAEISLDVVRLCEKYRNSGVVAIDIAGDENAIETTEPTHQKHFDAFKVCGYLFAVVPLSKFSRASTSILKMTSSNFMSHILTAELLS